MHTRESILSTLYPRSRSQAPQALSDVSPQLGALSLSPQVSASSVKSSASKHEGSDIVNFKIRLETPPAIMYGSPQESVGALISGICDVDLTNCGDVDGAVDLQEANMSIVQVIRTKVPPSIAKKLPHGSQQRNVLAIWDILKHPHILASKTFAYPFSHLLPGTLPPTCRTPLFSIEYFIVAAATTQRLKKSEYRIPLKIGRSVMGITEKTSVRIFPPTTLSLSMILPTALFPNSNVNAEMRIEGLITDTTPGMTLKFKRWQLKRINWRVDEIVKVRWGEAGDDEYEYKHTLGFGFHKTGWKTDYSLQNGVIEFFTPDFCPGVLNKANKDLQDPVAGLSVSHQLICELLIAEEVLSNPTSKQGVLSGSARVLRMQFGFPVVDRPGLGISWEDEVPPVYADVPLSPPQYNEVADLPSFEEITTNSMVFSPLLVSKMSPTLRHFDSSIRGFEHRPPPSPLAQALGSAADLCPVSSTKSIPSVMSHIHQPLQRVFTSSSSQASTNTADSALHRTFEEAPRTGERSE